ncbi:MAG: phosphate ABC transporter permease subunit PstC, partial [Anaerolineales bacterium]
MKIKGSWTERIIVALIKVTGYSAILFVGLIQSGAVTLIEVPLINLLSKLWYPIEGFYGLQPLIWGSIIVTIGATMIAVPVGVGTAIFIAEIAPPRAR